MSTLADRENPWLGLAAFGEGERDYFFGRANETAELQRLVEDESLVVLYGISGLGKTSLLQAGLFPVLREHDFLPVLLRPYHDAEAAKRTSGRLPATITRGHTGETIAATVRAAAEAGGKAPEDAETAPTLWEFFHHRTAQFWSARNRLLTPVLVFDQFEEFFTLGAETDLRRQHTAQFFQQLGDLIYNRPPALFQARFERGTVKPDDFEFAPVRLRVVLSLREDFLPQLSELREHGFPTLLRSALRLRPLSAGAAHECIERPAPELLAPGVAARLVRFLAGAETGGTTTAPGDTAAATERHATIEPALLSVVCHELNAERRRRGLAQINADLLTLSQEQILADFYERSWAGIAPELRMFVEDELLSPGGFRDSRALDDALTRPGLSAADIARLIDRRILHYQDRQDGPRRIELTHDLLCRVVRASRTRREEFEKARAADEAKQRAEAEARQAAERLAAAEAARAHEERLRHEAEAARGRARRLALLSGTLALVAILAGAFSVVLYFRAVADRQTADEQRQRAEAGEQAAQAAKDQAVAAKRAADELVQYLLYDLPNEASTQGNRYSIWESINRRAREYFDRFPPEQSDLTGLRSRIKAVRDQGSLLQSQGRYDEALAIYRDALATTRQLVTEHPEDMTLRFEISNLHAWIGSALQYQGKFRDSAASLRESIATLEQMLATNSDEPEWLRALGASQQNLGYSLERDGQRDAAIAIYEQTLATRERCLRLDPGQRALRDDFDYALVALANAQFNAGRTDDAVANYTRGLELRRANARDHPDDMLEQERLADSLASLGGIMQRLGRLDEAIAHYRENLAMREEFASGGFPSPRTLRGLADAHAWLAGAQQQQGRTAEAVEPIRAAVETMRRALAAQPEDYDYQQRLITILQTSGGILAAHQDFSTALAHMREALTLAEAFARHNPEDGVARRMVDFSHDYLAGVLVARQELEAATTEYRAALERRETAAREHVDDDTAQFDLALGLRNVGDALLARRDLQGARPYYERLRDLDDRLAEMYPGTYNTEVDRAYARAQIATCSDTTTPAGRAAARATLQEAVEILRRLRDTTGLQGDHPEWLAEYERRLASFDATP